jgi:hypothetical protein
MRRVRVQPAHRSGKVLPISILDLAIVLLRTEFFSKTAPPSDIISLGNVDGSGRRPQRPERVRGRTVPNRQLLSASSNSRGAASVVQPGFGIGS